MFALIQQVLRRRRRKRSVWTNHKLLNVKWSNFWLLITRPPIVRPPPPPIMYLHQFVEVDLNKRRLSFVSVYPTVPSLIDNHAVARRLPRLGVDELIQKSTPLLLVFKQPNPSALKFRLGTSWHYWKCAEAGDGKRENRINLIGTCKSLIFGYANEKIRLEWNLNRGSIFQLNVWPIIDWLHQS